MTWEERRAQALEIEATGDALAEASWERGERLTEDNRHALRHWSMFGSDGYPVQKLGRGWSVDHPSFGFQGYDRKRDAVRAWEVHISKLVRMSGLEAQERALAEQSAMGRTLGALCDAVGFELISGGMPEPKA